VATRPAGMWTWTSICCSSERTQMLKRDVAPDRHPRVQRLDPRPPKNAVDSASRPFSTTPGATSPWR
jgi:hypothetical protein